MSAEPGRKTAYSNDLRWRIVYQRIAVNLPLVKIAQNLNVAVSTVHHIYRLFEESGTVDPLSPRKRLECRRLDLRSELYVVGVMYLGELCVEIMHVFGIEISPSTVCRTLRRYGLTRKKIRQVALQRSSELRGAFMAQCFLLKRDMLVWTIGIYVVLTATFKFCAIFTSGRFIAILWQTMRHRRSFEYAVFLPGSADISDSNVQTSHLYALYANLRRIRITDNGIFERNRNRLYKFEKSSESTN